MNYLLKNGKLLLVSFLIFFLFFIFDLWKIYPLYLFGSDQLFTDWNYIYDYFSCKKNISVRDLNCAEILNYNFVYPNIWFKIVEFTYFYFKYLIIFLILVYIFIVIKIFEKINKIFFFLFLFSPTSLLLIQRGNNELLILIIIYFFFKFLTNEKLKYLSLIPYIFASILKIYPLSLFILYFFSNYKKDLVLKLISVFIFISILFLCFEQFFQIYKSHNPGNVVLIYGSSSFFFIFNLIFKNAELNITLISSIFFLFFVIFSLFIKIDEVHKYESPSQNLYLIGSIILILSFFFNSSFDYRFIYVLFTIPYLFEIGKYKKLKISKYLIILIYLVIWSEFLIFYSIEISDFNKVRSELGNVVNHKTIFVGILITLKNLIYWIINLIMIVITKNIIASKLIKFVFFLR